MKTSYFQNPKLRTGDYYPVQISRYASRWGVKPQGKFCIWPTEKMFESGYEADEYYSLLDAHKADIFSALKLFPKNTVFLCHEKNPDLCHRRLFAAWLEEETGQVIEEL